MKRTAVFPGSFDPVTLGHTNVLYRAVPLFDKIIVAVGENTEKNSFFSMEDRLKMLKKTFQNEAAITVESFNGLTVNFCKEKNAGYILRGLRNSKDYEYESAIAAMNHKMAKDIESVFLFSDPAMGYISSTIVREIIANGGDISSFVPGEVIEIIKTGS